MNLKQEHKDFLDSRDNVDDSDIDALMTTFNLTSQEASAIYLEWLEDVFDRGAQE